jgi:hypothetical protein
MRTGKTARLRSCSGPSDHRWTLATEQGMWLGYIVLCVVILRGDDSLLAAVICCREMYLNGMATSGSGLGQARKTGARNTKGGYCETKFLEVFIASAPFTAPAMRGSPDVLSDTPVDASPLFGVNKISQLAVVAGLPIESCVQSR